MGGGFVFAAALTAITVQSSVPTQTQWEVVAPFSVPAADDRCVAIAVFQRGSETLRFALEARPTSVQYAVLVEAPGSLGRRPWIEGRYSIGSVQPEQDIVVAEAGARKEAIVYQLKANRSELKSVGADPSLKVRMKPNQFDIGLRVPGIGAALDSLDSCSSNLLSKWGYTSELQRNTADYPRPERNIFTYATSNDYPRSALAAGAMGEAHVLVSVGVDRRASDCRTIRSSSNKDIDAMTCRIVTERVRYIPGRDRSGRPIAAPLYLTMRWEIPR